MLREGFVQVGVVAGVHGREGRLRIRPITDNPARYRPGSVVHISGTPHTVESVATAGQYLLVKLAGLESAQQAHELANAVVEVPAGEVPPAPDGAYYHFQLLEAEVHDTAGAYLGRLVEGLSTGANDVYIVRNESTELLVPAMADVVVSVDVAAGRVTVDLPPGLEPQPLSARKLASRRPRRRRKTRPGPGSGSAPDRV